MVLALECSVTKLQPQVSIYGSLAGMVIKPAQAQSFNPPVPFVTSCHYRHDVREDRLLLLDCPPLCPVTLRRPCFSNDDSY